jgi:hypothetical protein
VPNNNWFAVMFSGGIPSSNATGWKKGKHKSDDCGLTVKKNDCGPLDDNPSYYIYVRITCILY